MFKKRVVNKSLRTKRTDDSDDDDSAITNVGELREIQRLKKRVNKGVNVEELLVAPSSSSSNEKVVTKELKFGLVDAKALKNELDLGNTFSVETNRRDEDADMMKFIEEELAKRKGTASESVSEQTLVESKTSEDIIFDVLPKHLIADNKKKNEEMLSSQMLSGIPEIDLGLHEKIRNIEATEEAKVKHMENRRKRYDDSSNLIPTNIAVNFVQHNRYNVADNVPQLAANMNKKPRVVAPVVAVVEEPVVVIGEEPRQGRFKNWQPRERGQLKHPGREKATDDYHFDRFRKQFRK